MVDINDPLFLHQKRRFVIVIFFLVYFQSQKQRNQLRELFFALHWRGLSYTGFHLLHELGLFAAVRSLKDSFSAITKKHTVESDCIGVHWFDNMVVDLLGDYVNEKTVSMTVYGITQLPSNVKPVKFNGVKSIDSSMLSQCAINYLAGQIATSSFQSVLETSNVFELSHLNEQFL